MIESGAELLEAMHWNNNSPKGRAPQQQRKLILNLPPDHQSVYNILNEKGELEIDKLVIDSALNSSMLAATLLEMEMDGIIVSLPGKRYKLI